MSIAEKLSWEIVALNDRGNASNEERLALEIAYGIAFHLDEPELFITILASVISQVTDTEVRRFLRHWQEWTKRGLRK